MLLVPCDVLRPRRPDEHFAGEAAAARAAGMPVAVVDHDALTRGTAQAADAAVARVPAGDGAVYRGWMLRSGDYAGFAAALERRGVRLRTGAEDYRRGHELPGWYPAAQDCTPESVWTEGDGRDGFLEACAGLGKGAAVLRDWTKSMKHYWDEACFIPDVTDVDAAWRVARRFRELRDDEFTGGFVLRRFEDFSGAEARTWWVDGECRLVSAHPDSPDRLPGDVDLTVVAAAIRELASPFVTADLVRRTDGRWRLVEIGDGQVSDRPSSADASRLIRAII
ncbi:ATP-grasp domain-containing protein [Actinoplanes sp. NBRC 101535]|uniref:ATP-grasp domain-containing protein n=1 Tax=Actinoplanes sp. NBRC 101535 TaxID=3032196 RepID=UPI0024A553F2|nr:ATP-grasp domain-containing protein [Actinoplanes sp. NBRC 101535]GLY07030.1 hypothetical protein Acsp01_74090 [Actinoplanes sp. NBRC 101535]